MPIVGLYITYDNNKTVIYAMNAVAACVSGFVSWRAALLAFDWDQFLAIPNAPIAPLQSLVQFEYALYFTYTIIDAWNGSIEQVLHHMCAMTCIYFADVYGAYHMLCAYLCAFNTTTPCLDVAKFARHMEWHVTSQFIFALFTLGFFGCRVCAVPYLMYSTIFSGTLQRNNVEGISLVSLLSGMLTLYFMQISWFSRILRVWRGILLRGT